MHLPGSQVASGCIRCSAFWEESCFRVKYEGERARATEMASPYESASLGTSGAHLLPFGVQTGAPCAIVLFGSLRTCSVADVASAGVGQDMPSPTLLP